MSATNIYGEIWSPKQVEKRIIGALRDWLPYYLGELERIDEYDPGSLPVPLDYVRASEFAKHPEEQLPVVLVIAGEAIPRAREEGRYEATFPVGIAPVVSDPTDEDASRDVAGTYGAAIRAAVLQHKRLRSTEYPDGIDGSVVWTHESYTDLAFNTTRSLGTSRVIFAVTINSAVTANAGPRALPVDPPDVDPGPWPDVQPGYPQVNVEPVEELPHA